MRTVRSLNWRGLAEAQRGLLTRYASTDISKYISHIVFSVVLGVFAGAGAILFHTMLEGTRHFFEFFNLRTYLGVDFNLIFIFPVAGAVVVAAMTRYLPSIARERDVTSVIKSVLFRNGFIPFKVTLFHFFAPIISIGSGAPLGPEGPAAKMGSGLGSLMAQIFRLNQREMRMYAVAGAGAAIAAVFNAPIAGVFFGIEVILLNDLKNQAMSALVISSVVADVFSRAILGNKHVFRIPQYSSGDVGDFPYFLLLAILCGAVSILFFQLRRGSSFLLVKKLRLSNEFLRLVPVAALFGIVLLFFHQLYGIGYSTINEVLNHHYSLVIVLALLALKLIFMALFLEAGSYGGTFAPSLMIGVLLGHSFAVLTNAVFATSLDPVVFALVGMGGVLAGINAIPLTSILLVFEVTGDYHFILPLMFVSIIAYLVVIYINKGGTYTLELMKEGIDVSKRGEMDLLGKIKVRELRKTDFDVVSHRTPFRKLADILMHSTYGDVFVLNDRKDLLGVISLRQVRQAIVSHELTELLIADDVIAEVPVVTEDDPVSFAMQKIEEYDLETIPVVKSEKNRSVTGVLTHRDIIQAYNRLLDAWTTDQFLTDSKPRGS